MFLFRLNEGLRLVCFHNVVNFFFQTFTLQANRLMHRKEKGTLSSVGPLYFTHPLAEGQVEKSFLEDKLSDALLTPDKQKTAQTFKTDRRKIKRNALKVCRL